jgi:tetratricopeptide (TPR) repeat protein
VRVLVRLASGPLRDSSLGPERKSALSAEALEIARRLGDPATLADALNGYIVGRHSPDHTHRQLELASELVEVATRVGDKERALDGHELRLTALLELGDKPGALAALEAMTTLTRELRQPAQNWFVAVYRALFALLEGRLDQAEELISDARLLGERAQSWEAAVSYRLQLYLLRREQGRLEAAEDIVRRSVQEYPTYPIWRCVLAQMAAELGHAVEAREALNALATSGFTTLPFDEEWLVSVGLLAETAAALKDGERASVLYELLVPYGDRVAISYPEICTGAVARYLGLLATTMKRWDDAERHFGSAIEVNRRIGARSWLARSQRDHATMLLARRAAA